MSYGPVLLVSRNTVAATVSIALATEFPGFPAKGVWRSVNFFVQTANGANTPDHDFSVRWFPPGGNTAIIASATNITGDTLTQLVLQSEFSGQNEAIPMPIDFRIVRTTGDVDVDLWAMFSR